MSGVIALGECMVELSLKGPGQAVIGFAGDTFNTAVYLSRLGLRVSYATALGADDPFSAGILSLMGEEGLDRSLVAKVEGRVPGLYAIERDAAGERKFYYWRSEAPVRQFFDFTDRAALTAAANSARLIYLSGITVAVLGDAGRSALLDLLTEARSHGASVAFDPNYRARLWASPAAAREATEALVPICRFVSASAPDLQTLYPEPVDQIAARWAMAGPEVVARAEDQTVWVHGAGEPLTLPPESSVRAVDTTGAGDSFNAGYLAARLGGETPEAAVAAGRKLARAVVQRMGAIIPKAAMP
jgi:2-dehydro-3-deoxygluconokinase